MTRLTVWHDGDCPLCRREIALMRRLDRRGAIRFVDATDEGAACPIDRAPLLARFHAEEDGQLLSGAAAFAAMWRAIPVLPARPAGARAVGVAAPGAALHGFSPDQAGAATPRAAAVATLI